MTSFVVPVGLNPGIRSTANTFSLTYRDDGEGEVTGTGLYEFIYRDEKCGKDLPSSVRWEMTGRFDPATQKFSGTMQG